MSGPENLKILTKKHQLFKLTAGKGIINIHLERVNHDGHTDGRTKDKPSIEKIFAFFSQNCNVIKVNINLI